MSKELCVRTQKECGYLNFCNDVLALMNKHKIKSVSELETALKKLDRIENIFSMEIASTKHTPKNCKYVKLNYTKDGTVVLTGTNNPNEKIEVEELERFLK